MKIGFIGGGNMGSAIIKGVLAGGLAAPADIMASDAFAGARERLQSEQGIAVTADNRAVVDFAEILFFAVKPQMLPGVIDGIKDMDFSSKLIVSIAAGQSLERITGMLGKQVKLVRVMPNTPALVGEGMAALSPNELVTEEEAATVKQIFESFGKAEIVPERLQDAVVGISGSSPAYVFMFIEALADGAVAEGMPRAQAYKFAAQAVLGSAKMVLETGQHPGELKDAVCSPAGTTIEAVAALEAAGFRSAVIEAERVCIEKSREL